jgi:hypothetical protein
VLGCGGKDAENSPRSRRFLPPFHGTQTIAVRVVACGRFTLAIGVDKGVYSRFSGPAYATSFRRAFGAACAHYQDLVENYCQIHESISTGLGL